MPKPSLAEQFYNDILNARDRAQFLRELATSTPPTFENEWRDFKNQPASDDKLKEIWYTALAGFATTQGGVLVWGIDARKDATGVDAANQLKHVDNPSAFKSRLNELLRNATDPPVLGIEIEEIPDPATQGKGFVVCLIPEGRFKPYRAEIPGNRQYFIRAGDNFVVPAPSLLRSLFYPQLNAVLWLEATLVYELGRDNQSKDMVAFRCEVRIHNSGTATARDTFVVVQVDLPNSEKLDNSKGVDWLLAGTPQGKFAWEAKKPLHPGSVSILSGMTWVTPTTIDNTHRVVPPPVTFKLKFLMFADNLEPQVASVEFEIEGMEEGRPLTKRGISEVGDWHLTIP